MLKSTWDELLAKLRRHTCECGSGDVALCGQLCRGDLRDVVMVEALQAIIITLRDQQADQHP